MKDGRNGNSANALRAPTRHDHTLVWHIQLSVCIGYAILTDPLRHASFFICFYPGSSKICLLR